jgi:pimeloyl-ACP methyl ester carboxylesterase
VEAAVNYCFDILKVQELWVVGWSFGTEIALCHARDARIKGLILLSPPLMKVEESDLQFWAEDGRPITALVPEHDDYLKPDQARIRFASIPQLDLIAVDGAKHLWVGEPYVHRVLSEIVRIIAPSRLPLRTELISAALHGE